MPFDPGNVDNAYQNRNFILWVEAAFRNRSLSCDVLYLNPRLPLNVNAVVKRQVSEGVAAVVFLNRQMQLTSKVSIQVYNRRQAEATYDRMSSSWANSTDG